MWALNALESRRVEFAPVSPILLPLFWPSWPSGHLVPPGPGVGWGGSIETLAEHEADANRESE